MGEFEKLPAEGIDGSFRCNRHRWYWYILDIIGDVCCDLFVLRYDVVWCGCGDLSANSLYGESKRFPF